MPYDNTCKYLAEKYPDRFATWLLGQPAVSATVMKTELSIEPIRADFVTFLRTEERILHLEFQVNPNQPPPISLRMLDYWVRLYRTYGLPVTQFLILLKYSPAAAEVKSKFQVENTCHSYQVVRMWEQDPAPFFQDPALVPLAALCVSEDSTQLLSQPRQWIK